MWKNFGIQQFSASYQSIRENLRRLLDTFPGGSEKDCASVFLMEQMKSIRNIQLLMRTS
jgi:hypothetical protein